MAVRCVGDSRLMEQVGEKQDFESALTQRALRHEDFMLSVHRPVPTAHAHDWTQDYTVTVVWVITGGGHRYAGGPRHNWVAQFLIDVSRGVYGVAPASDDAAQPGAAESAPPAIRNRASAFQRGAN